MGIFCFDIFGKDVEHVMHRRVRFAAADRTPGLRSDDAQHGMMGQEVVQESDRAGSDKQGDCGANQDTAELWCHADFPILDKKRKAIVIVP
jgi:hypothetical protein